MRPGRDRWGYRRARRTAAIAIVAVAAAAAGSASCGSGTGAEPVPSAPATAAGGTTTLAANGDGLAATLEQYRSDLVTDQLMVQVVHRGPRAVRLSALRLVWPGLEPVPPSRRSDLVSPGQTVDLPIDFGESVCASPPRGDEPPPAEPAVAEATATWADTGETTTVRIPVTDTRRILARVYPPSCRRQSVTSAAAPSWEPAWTDVTLADGRPGLAGTLRLDRRLGTDPVRITAVAGSVLLTVTPAPGAGGPLLVLDPAADAARLPVVIAQSGNCAPHALAESKQTFLLPVTFVVGDRPDVVVDVVPDDASKARLNAMINHSCGVA